MIFKHLWGVVGHCYYRWGRWHTYRQVLRQRTALEDEVYLLYRWVRIYGFFERTMKRFYQQRALEMA